MSLKNLIASFALVGAAFSAFADYPDRPVKVINPFAVGGAGDIIQRLFAQKLTERTGKTFLVENKTGAGGRIGYDAVAKSRNDGYTLVASDTGYSVLAALFGKLPWDHENDLVPVTVYARTPFSLVTNVQSRFRTLPELLEYARANPGKVNYGTAGTGSIPHVAMETIQREAGVKMQHVPFRSGGEALAALLGNSIDLLITGVPTAVGAVKNGQINVLAVTSRERWPALDRVPTLMEQGVKFNTYLWFGLMAPKGTPKPVIDYLHQQVVNAIADPRVKENLAAQGVVGWGAAPTEMARLIQDETKLWTQTVREQKITPE